MLSQLGDVKSQQVSLGGQMAVLQGQLDKANQLAVARAGDTKVGRRCSSWGLPHDKSRMQAH